MGNQRVARLPILGRYLKQTREKKRILQQDIADRVTKHLKQMRLAKKEVSQGLIAQYEAGLIGDPDPQVLEAIAEVLGVDWLNIILMLVREKYDPADRWQSGISKLRWDVIEATWTPQDAIGGQKDTDGSTLVEEVDGFAEDQLRAKADLIARGTLIPRKSLARWEKLVGGITEYWILAADFLAFDDPFIQNAVISNLSRTPPVKYVYYLNPTRSDNFLAYRDSLADRTELSRSRRRRISELVRMEPLEEDALRWLVTDHLVAVPANPHRAIVFRYLRLGEQLYAYRLSSFDVDRLLGGLRSWMARRSIRSRKKTQ